MADPGDPLYDPRLFAPEPDSPCDECGVLDPFHLFACPLHIDAEGAYAEAEDGAACFVCTLPKPEHTLSCYRGPDHSPHSRLTPASFDDTQGEWHV